MKLHVIKLKNYEMYLKKIYKNVFIFDNYIIMYFWLFSAKLECREYINMMIMISCL